MPAVATLSVVVVGCGGLALSNSADSGTDRGSASHVDSGSVDERRTPTVAE
jgi:hypothetical protein